MMPRPHSWHVPSPGHRATGRPDPAEQLAVPVPAMLPETARGESRPPVDESGDAALRQPPGSRPH